MKITLVSMNDLLGKDQVEEFKQLGFTFRDDVIVGPLGNRQHHQRRRLYGRWWHSSRSSWFLHIVRHFQRLWHYRLVVRCFHHPG